MAENVRAARPRRLLPLTVLVLGVAIASNCRCRESHDETTPAELTSPTAVAPSATAVPVGTTVTPSPTGAGVLYSWANPLSVVEIGLDFADHTWVTSFDSPSTCPPHPEYWYSWGSCHGTGGGTTARDLTRGSADLRVARCICQPDVEDFHPTAGNLSHGGIDLYGIQGVCHQLANRILWATSAGGAPPATVDEAHGYGFSRFLYGTYGANANEWEARKARCTASVAGPAPAPTAAMIAAASPIVLLDQDLAAMFQERLKGDYSRGALSQIVDLRHQLFARKALLDRRVRGGDLPPRQYADQVNELLNEYLPRVAEILGAAQYQRLFGQPPGRRVGVVDPEIAARSSYRPG